jgi:hypothetical protein
MGEDQTYSAGWLMDKSDKYCTIVPGIENPRLEKQASCGRGIVQYSSGLSI